ncbi:hypothetical protein F4810DRAFT_652190 [Camillea tinctor]|nr:hypothetical protein F4810DRAFT_652190 [Camillea tinctor]
MINIIGPRFAAAVVGRATYLVGGLANLSCLLVSRWGKKRGNTLLMAYLIPPSLFSQSFTMLITPGVRERQRTRTFKTQCCSVTSRVHVPSRLFKNDLSLLSASHATMLSV